MARTGLRVLLCACVLTAGLTAWRATAGDGPDQRQRKLLAVQAALEKGLAALQRGDHATAVVELEKEVAHIDGNRQYLNALRDAYRGHVADLDRAGKHDDAKRY